MIGMMMTVAGVITIAVDEVSNNRSLYSKIVMVLRGVVTMHCANSVGCR
jgi:nitrate reductase gamma subunit